MVESLGGFKGHRFVANSSGCSSKGVIWEYIIPSYYTRNARLLLQVSLGEARVKGLEMVVLNVMSCVCTLVLRD